MQQNPVALAWFLYCKNKSLGLHSLGLQKKRGRYGIKTLIQHQLKLQNNVSVLILPVYGNVCLQVQGGYKVFDFRRRAVTKVFDADVDTVAVMKEIEGVRNASLLAFAPKIRHWSVAEQWYEEDFVRGSIGYSIPQSKAINLFQIYHQHIAPFIESMILLWPSLKTKVGAYLDEATDFLDDQRLSDPSLDVNKIKKIRSFISFIIKSLYLDSNCQVNLVFSHGDFSVVNILQTKNGMMVIDWESVAYRSILYDFYNYFFTELYYERVTTNLIPEVNNAIQSLQSQLVLRSPNIAETLLSLTALYRKLYYFERIRMLLARRLSDKLLDVVIRSIKVFDAYEEAIGDKYKNHSYQI